MPRYLVMGRTQYNEPLALQGVVEAAGPEEACALALQRFGPHWVELTLVPEADVHRVVGSGPLPERVGAAGTVRPDG